MQRFGNKVLYRKEEKENESAGESENIGSTFNKMIGLVLEEGMIWGGTARSHFEIENTFSPRGRITCLGCLRREEED